MKQTVNWLMNRRARSITKRLEPWLCSTLKVADVGSGTGHNAEEWRKSLQINVTEFDVADFHVVGSGPRLFDGTLIQERDATFSAVTLLFILHYSKNPMTLLQECKRITAGPLLVLQSTYIGRWGYFWLWARELLWGRGAFVAARFAGVIRCQDCPLMPRTFFTRESLLALFREAELNIAEHEVRKWWGLGISRDLFVLRQN